MARAVYRNEFMKVVNNVLVPAANATVTVYEAGTVTPIAATMYQGPTGGATFSNPLTADADGTIQFYLDLPQAIKIVATATGLGTITVDNELALVDQKAQLRTFYEPIVSGQLRMPAGTKNLPSVANQGNLNTGIYWPATNEVALVGGNAGEFVVSGDSNASARARIFDSTWTKHVLQVNRGGGASQGIVPDTSVTAAFQTYSFQSGNNSAATFEAVKGATYVAGGRGSFHIGSSGIVEITSLGSWLPPDNGSAYGAIGIFGQALTNKEFARLWGANFRVISTIGNQTDHTGIEIGMDTVGTIARRYGLTIATLENATHSGTEEDLAVRLSDKKGSGEGHLWDVGIGFASPGAVGSSGFPIKSTGTLIKAYGTKTIARGIDWTTIGFSAPIFQTSNFCISNLGRLSVGTSTAAASAPLLINRSGEPFNIEIINPVTQGTAGSLNTYWIARIGNATLAIPAYNLS